MRDLHKSNLAFLLQNALTPFANERYIKINRQIYFLKE